MNLHPYSTKQLDSILNENNVYDRLHQLLENDDIDLDSLKVVGKICMMEFGIKPDEWDKLMLLLKIASCCNEND